MFPKYYEVFDLDAVFLRLKVIFLNKHKNVDLIKCKLEVLSLGFDDFEGDILFVFMVVGLNDIPERPTPQPLDELIPKPDVVVLDPQIVALKVILVAGVDLIFESHIVHFLLVDNFDLFDFAEVLRVLLEDLFAVDSLELAGEGVLHEIGATLGLPAGAVVGLGEELGDVLLDLAAGRVLLLLEQDGLVAGVLLPAHLLALRQFDLFALAVAVREGLPGRLFVIGDALLPVLPEGLQVVQGVRLQVLVGLVRQVDGPPLRQVVPQRVFLGLHPHHFYGLVALLLLQELQFDVYLHLTIFITG